MTRWRARSPIGDRRRRSKGVLVASAAGTVLSLAIGSIAYGAGEVGVSPTGPASGSVVAVSGTGTASSTGGVAVSGTGASSGKVAVSAGNNATSNSSSGGVALSGLGEANGGLVNANAAINWVNTPDGPVAVGASVRSVVHTVEAVVAQARSLVERTVLEVVNTDPLSQVLDAEGNQTGYGCPPGASGCTNVRLAKAHRLAWDYYSECCRMFYGMTVASFLVPSSDPGGDYVHDFFYNHSTLTGQGAGICGIKHSVTMSGPDDHGYWGMNPTGETNVPDGGTKSGGISMNAFGFSGSYGWSHPTYSGKIRGDYDPATDKATGSWRTSRLRCPASGAQGGSVSFDSGAAYVWPRYGGGSGRRYTIRVVVTYQDVTW
jgi:hypothetical protein